MLYGGAFTPAMQRPAVTRNPARRSQVAMMASATQDDATASELEDELFNFQQVDDWDKFFADNTDEDKKIYQYLKEKTQELKDRLKDQEGWNVETDDRKKDLLIETKKQKSGCMSVRAKGTVNFAPLDVWRTVNYIPFRTKWDDNQESMQYVSKIGANTYRGYSRTKKIAIVSGRDFLVHGFTDVDPDGTIINVVVTPPSDPTLEKQFPPQKGVVRGTLPLSGWVFKVDPTDKNKCHLSMY